MKLVAVSTAVALLAGCAAMPGSVDPAFDPAATEFTGWVRFSNDEFQLYGDEDQVLQPFSRPCVSGAASRDEMREARLDLNNAKVRITGTTRPWSEAANGRIAHQGSDIRNDCGGAFVIVADDIRPAN